MDLPQRAGGKPRESKVFSRGIRLPMNYPMLRGMISYGISWPCSSIAQEYIEFGTLPSQANWTRAFRFSIFGAFFMSPVFYKWLQLSSPWFRTNTLSMAIKRAVFEQLTYGPMALAYFIFGMGLLEGQTVSECKKEVQKKFWPTYATGLMFWPPVQAINFRFISKQNRMVYISAVSFIWTCYLAHVKSKKYEN